MGVQPRDAELHRERFAVRLIDNRAVSVVYRIFRQRGTSNTGTVPATPLRVFPPENTLV